ADDRRYAVRDHQLAMVSKGQPKQSHGVEPAQLPAEQFEFAPIAATDSIGAECVKQYLYPDATQSGGDEGAAKTIGHGARLTDVELECDTVLRSLNALKHRLEGSGTGRQPSKHVTGLRHWRERCPLPVIPAASPGFVHARTYVARHLMGQYILTNA